MGYKNIQISTENLIATVIINRPQVLNALNTETINELSLVFTQLAKDKTVKVIILTGNGNKSFVAGADIKEFLDLSGDEGKQLAQNGQDILFNKIEQMNKPVIAAINGFALGGGLELALACHFRIASTNAKLGLPEVTLGLIPGYGGTQRLAQIIGKGRAMQAIFTAQFFDANRAQEMGLVNEVVEQEKLLERCNEIANQITKNSSTAIEKSIQCINLYNQPKVGFEKEINSFGDLFQTHDFKEGTTAFIEKRMPNFD